MAVARIARSKGNSQVLLFEQPHGIRISGTQSNSTRMETIFELPHKDPTPKMNVPGRTNATTIVGRNRTASKNMIDTAARIFTDLGQFIVLMLFIS